VQHQNNAGTFRQKVDTRSKKISS